MPPEDHISKFPEKNKPRPSVESDSSVGNTARKTEAEDTLDKFLGRLTAAEKLTLPEKQELTRSQITMTVIRTFCATLIIFAVFICGIGAFGDVSRLSSMSEMIQLILAAASPVVTFILGYYFATKGLDN